VPIEINLVIPDFDGQMRRLILRAMSAAKLSFNPPSWNEPLGPRLAVEK
jgi:hypothetical protein